MRRSIVELNHCRVDTNRSVMGVSCVFFGFSETSAGLTTAENVAIAAGSALWGTPRSLVLNPFLLHGRVDVSI